MRNNRSASQQRSLFAHVRGMLEKERRSLVRWRLVRAATGSFGLKIINNALLLIITIVLARTLGKSGYGLYAYAMAWVRLLLIPATLGLPQLLTREVAVARSQKNWGIVRGLLVWSNRTTLIVSLSISIFAAITLLMITEVFAEKQIILWVALMIVPVLALTRVRQGTLIGLQYIVAGQLPDLLVQPLFLLFLVVGGFLVLGNQFSPIIAMGMNVSSFVLAFVIGGILLFQRLPVEVRTAVAQYQTRLWFMSVLPLLITRTANVINDRVDAVMLGGFIGTDVVGVYNAALRGAEIITLAQLAVGVTLAPTIAKLFAEGKHQQLQSLLTRSVRITFLIAAIITGVLILFRQWYLWLFGPEFVIGGHALMIMSIGRLLNVSAGIVTVILVMTKHERASAIYVSSAAILNVLLNVLWIPRWGMEGAALASAISLLVRNFLGVAFVIVKLKIDPTIIGYRFKQTPNTPRRG